MASREDALAMLDGLYEHSPWIVEAALDQRPFASVAALKHALATIVDKADVAAQLALIRAHPELAGKAMVSKSLTAESTNEQSKAGLASCTPEEFARIQQLNADYNARFGFPFILAVRGPRGVGLDRQTIIATFARRLRHHPDEERAEALRNIHRIAEIRLNDKFDCDPVLGHHAWDQMEALSRWTDPGYVGTGQLTVTYLTPAHRACANEIADTMRAHGFDTVEIDAVGNVVGRYLSDNPSAKTLMTGSHYDTVRNGGKYDGRLGVYVPLVCISELHKQQIRLPYHVEVIAFAEEEAQRFNATFLGSSALTGTFNPDWLMQQDADGVILQDLMREAGLDTNAIAGLKRDSADYLGFVEVHIEQGPVLQAAHLPLGVVHSINGNVRFVGKMTGLASHAGTTPMATRRDAAAAVAELVLYVEERAAQDGDSVGTVGMLHVPNGSINVIAGQCHFSLDLRAPNDAQRDALVADVLSALERIACTRGVSYTLEETVRISAAPSNPALQRHWENAVANLGLPIHTMVSGAGHDAMKIHDIMPQAMLFVRGQNGGISHNPLESTTSDDMQLAIEAFDLLLQSLAKEMR